MWDGTVAIAVSPASRVQPRKHFTDTSQAVPSARSEEK